MCAKRRRYEGIRWRILYGNYEGVQRTAVNELQRFVQSYLPYVPEILPAGAGSAETHEILVGTVKNHSGIPSCQQAEL
ncbi:MAG: hypothetical protein GX811_00075 [Lentisphaerae bacterium]|nr:hypothetical protein [Lentisphaerota bacterium]